MKKRSIMLGSVVILAVLLVVGGTMAWFTAEAKPVVNTFKAGTVDINLIDEFPENGIENVNPGDTHSKVAESGRSLICPICGQMMDVYQGKCPHCR